MVSQHRKNQFSKFFRFSFSFNFERKHETSPRIVRIYNLKYSFHMAALVKLNAKYCFSVLSNHLVNLM